MKKLTLDELEVTSFVTLSEPQARGAVHSQQETVAPAPSFFLETWCGECRVTNVDFDCTYGCSQDTGCETRCVLLQP